MNFISLWAQGKNYPVIEYYSRHWTENVTMLFNGVCIGKVYVIFVLVACFVMPLLVGYLMHRNDARRVLGGIDASHNHYQNLAKECATRYKLLIDEFIKEQSESISKDSSRKTKKSKSRK